jgi:hypothetical protein
MHDGVAAPDSDQDQEVCLFLSQALAPTNKSKMQEQQKQPLLRPAVPALASWPGQGLQYQQPSAGMGRGCCTCSGQLAGVGAAVRSPNQSGLALLAMRPHGLP